MALCNDCKQSSRGGWKQSEPDIQSQYQVSDIQTCDSCRAKFWSLTGQKVDSE